MAGLQIWRHVPGKVLLFLINLVAATALIFEGMSGGFFLPCLGAPSPTSPSESSSRPLWYPVQVLTRSRSKLEGYNQGVLGTVSATPGFIKMADIGHDGVVTNTTKQGGLAAAYYFGGMWGCFIGGTITTLRRERTFVKRAEERDRASGRDCGRATDVC